MSWNELFKSTIISQYYDSQAEGREFESRFPLRQKGSGIAGAFCYQEFPTLIYQKEGRTDSKRRPRKWPFLSDGIPFRDLAPQVQNLFPTLIYQKEGRTDSKRRPRKWPCTKISQAA